MGTVDIFVNAFTRLRLDGIFLGEMQIANPRFTYPLGDAADVRAAVDMHVGIMQGDTLALAKRLFHGPETGYFLLGDRFYYRNCNICTDMGRSDAFYKGRFPHSFLRAQILNLTPFVVHVEATPMFVRESRSRFTRISSIDEMVNNIILTGSVYHGYLPMHAAAIDVRHGSSYFSLAFMGLPNTGKTSTSVAVRQALGGIYLAEDICFVRPDTLRLYGGPFTLDERKIQNYESLRATRYCGGELGCIVMVNRTPSEPGMEDIAPGAPLLCEFVVSMNRYEFEWNHDIFVRHLMLGGVQNGYSNSAVTNCYLKGLLEIAYRVPAVRLFGADPSQWGPLLTRHFMNGGLDRLVAARTLSRSS
jgi:hypothetical protein